MPLTLAVVLALRNTVLALLLGGVSRDRLRFAALFYLAMLPVMLLLAALDFTAYAILYARVFWPAVGMLALVVLVAGPAPWQVITSSSPGGRTTRPGAAAGRVAAADVGGGFFVRLRVNLRDRR